MLRSRLLSERSETKGVPVSLWRTSSDGTLVRYGHDMPFVYILKCRDGSFYTGSTVDLEFRLAQHQFGEGGDYTRRRRPVELVWSSEFSRVDEAFGWERRIHGWSRAKKILLIEGRYDELPGWSKRQREKGDGG